MHERGVAAEIVRRAEQLARDHGGARIAHLHITIGALAAISPEAFRHQFSQAAVGSTAGHADLVIDVSDDVTEDNALGVVLSSIGFVEE